MGLEERPDVRPQAQAADLGLDVRIAPEVQVAPAPAVRRHGPEPGQARHVAGQAGEADGLRHAEVGLQARRRAFRRPWTPRAPRRGSGGPRRDDPRARCAGPARPGSWPARAAGTPRGPRRGGSPPRAAPAAAPPAPPRGAGWRGSAIPPPRRRAAGSRPPTARPPAPATRGGPLPSSGAAPRSRRPGRRTRRSARTADRATSSSPRPPAAGPRAARARSPGSRTPPAPAPDRRGWPGARRRPAPRAGPAPGRGTRPSRCPARRGRRP